MNLDKLDPNLVVTLVTLLGSGIAWLYAKARGEKTQDAWELLEDVVISAISAGGVTLDNVRAKVEDAARAALAKRGIKGALAERLVHDAVEYGAAQLAKRFDVLRGDIDTLAKATVAVEAAFTPKGTMPKLDIDIEPMP